MDSAPKGALLQGNFGGVGSIRLEDARSSELMSQFQREHDEQVFAQLYALNAPRLERIVQACLRFGAPSLDAGEILQDVFVSVFRSAHRFRHEQASSFRIWSAQIARNAVRNALRERRLRKSRERSAILETLASRPEHPEAAQVWNEGRAAYPLVLMALAQGVDLLAERDRDVLVAADLDGESYGSIGARYGLRCATVRMVVFRARHRLFAHAERFLFVGVGARPGRGIR